jgi:hypothetical protein
MSAAYPKINFWDNLIPLRSGLDRPQLAGWTPGPPAKSGLGCVLYADQMIPVDDGVSLAADVYTPKVKGRYPAILVFSAYSKELQSSGAPTGTSETGSPSIFTDRGYAHVVIARRGRTVWNLLLRHYPAAGGSGETTAGAEGLFRHRDVHRLFSSDRDVWRARLRWISWHCGWVLTSLTRRSNCMSRRWCGHC